VRGKTGTGSAGIIKEVYVSSFRRFIKKIGFECRIYLNKSREIILSKKTRFFWFCRPPVDLAGFHPEHTHRSSKGILLKIRNKATIAKSMISRKDIWGRSPV
jgi:hypothetical protein